MPQESEIRPKPLVPTLASIHMIEIQVNVKTSKGVVLKYVMNENMMTKRISMARKWQTWTNHQIWRKKDRNNKTCQQKCKPQDEDRNEKYYEWKDNETETSKLMIKYDQNDG